jgi:hypothetical protein
MFGTEYVQNLLVFWNGKMANILRDLNDFINI